MCKQVMFSFLLNHNLWTIDTNKLKSLLLLHGLCSKIYGSGVPHSELKILAKVHLGVICAHIVDFCRLDHVYGVQKEKGYYYIPYPSNPPLVIMALLAWLTHEQSLICSWNCTGVSVMSTLAPNFVYRHL